MAECTQCCASSCPSERFFRVVVGGRGLSTTTACHPHLSTKLRELSSPNIPRFSVVVAHTPSLHKRHDGRNDSNRNKCGRKHNPVGSNKRTDNFAAACSICERSSQSIVRRLFPNVPLERRHCAMRRRTHRVLPQDRHHLATHHPRKHLCSTVLRPTVVPRRILLPQYLPRQSAHVEWRPLPYGDAEHL